MFCILDLQEGHKWLNSVHRVNEHNKPAIMAWETVSFPLSTVNTIYIMDITCTTSPPLWPGKR